MAKANLTNTQKRLLDNLVEHYTKNQHQFELILKQLWDLFSSDKELLRQVHSMKYRLKKPSRLKEKLRDKMREANQSGAEFHITKENLFYKINDLAGFRIIHLYTRQMARINDRLLAIFDEARYRKKEGPVAKTWDDESRTYFRSIGIRTEASPSMYTSVHYVIEPNSRTKYTCEIQVRTLMEEVWGEVSHTINYPRPIDDLASAEQIKALARVTSSCSRLVDSIFRTTDEHYKRVAASKRRKKRAQEG